MTPAQKEELIRKIEADIQTAHYEIRELGQKVHPIAPDCALGRLTRMEAIGEKSVNDALLEKTKRRLVKLEYIRRRADTERFGLCDKCDEPITFARLMIVPESTVCIPCQNEAD
jgi:DnaK suppressor protein